MADEKTQLTPMDIHNKEFKRRGRNGYDRYEVDSFLDEIVDDYGDALDQVVDLKNEIVSLNKNISQLQDQIQELKKPQNAVSEAQEEAKKIKQQAQASAQKIIAEAHTQQRDDLDFEKQQKRVISSDYKRVKQQVGEFRKHIQDMLQKEINDLNDDEWQHALDRYFHTTRLYQGGGQEPITLNEPGPEDEYIDEEPDQDAPVDNETADDVNSSQEPDDLDLDPPDDDDADSAPKPMTGDSPSHETINVPKKKPNLGPTIVFPDDYKSHK